MTKAVLLPALILPITLLLASCGSTSTPAAPASGSANTNISSSGSGGSAGGGTKVGAGDQTMSAEEAQILAETNAARAVARTCGDTKFAAAAPVTWNGYLATSARTHAADMAAQNYFSHVSPDGKTMVNRDEAAGYSAWKELGENIAAGYTLDNVVQGWIDSPSHCKTLMNPNLKEIGVGYTYKPGSQYGTYWVQDYGTR